MTQFLLMSAIVIFACVLCNKVSSRLGVPTLLAFILLGMFFGSDGVVKIPFDNYALAEDICSLALIFIMFYGGFGTNWQEARPVAGKAVLLSSLGTVLTAGLVGLFSWKVLGLPQLEGFLLGGNGYLSVYLTGILLGNQPLRSKQALVNFFDGATGLMQMVLFFLLGLLSFPSQLPAVAPTALAVALFLTFLARPIAVTLILGPFRSSLGQILLVSWSGMRGAASIVFSILAVTSPAVTDLDLYHIVFFIVLFSILVQGSLIPLVARKVKMTDGETDVMKTFNDYTDQVPVQFLQCTLTPGHPWAGKAIRDLDLPPACLLVLVTRQGEKLVPNGATVLEPGDQLVLSGRAGGELEGVCLYEKTIKKRDPWLHRPLSDLDTGEGLIILIRRAGDVVIPQGSTVLQEGDVLLISGQ